MPWLFFVEAYLQVSNSLCVAATLTYKYSPLGFVSSCQLFEQLAQDRILPQLYLKTMRVTSSPYISIFTCASFCALLYATAAADLSLLSKMSAPPLTSLITLLTYIIRFSFTFLCTMATFPLSLLLLKFRRRRLPRTPHTPLLLVFMTMGVSAVLIAGNIAIDPTTAGRVCYLLDPTPY